ncbi:unnamed protein product [Notodromas monacha]|uniref:Coatomer subunit beta n=1 Tax=Notodromas monacha TaxID=399045 RepID=A0A7R9BQU0_9CRUS|nr:unnamed protein product [Notodromas monacha]CAG0920012.1 unnamed protein product [Notodromas monacha]
MATEQPCYTLINSSIDGEQGNDMLLKQDLEKGDNRTKTFALKKAIRQLLAGDRLPAGMLMTIIRFVLPSQDHVIKKLLLIFWEVVPKTTSDGKLVSEMILVCDAFRKDLQHPNEYIRGSTLRFLCKLREPELLEPLVPAILACLEHRHAYVRRNAVLAVAAIHRKFDFLIPDGPDLVAKFLETESDPSCKRNAFMMLVQADQDRALAYLSDRLDAAAASPSASTTLLDGDVALQLVTVSLVYRVCRAQPSERGRFIRAIYNLLSSPSSSPAVRYEAAGTLVTLSTAPTAVRAAARAYIDLAARETDDNNVKLIVLDRLVALREEGGEGVEKVMKEMVMDVLRVLAAPDLEVRRKTLNLALDLVTSRTVPEAVLVLKKEVAKTHDAAESGTTGEEAAKYRQLLVRALHSICVRFPQVAADVVPALTEFLMAGGAATDGGEEAAAGDVLVFLREAAEKFTGLRPVVIEKLLEVFSSMKSAKVFRGSLWILGEFADVKSEVQSVMTQIRQALGDIPIVDHEMRKAAGDTEVESSATDITASGTPVQKLVTADGTYATQSVFSSSSVKKSQTANIPPLRKLLMEGDFFLGASMATTLAKLAIRYCSFDGMDAKKTNRFCAEAMLVMASILRLGKSGLPDKAITDDDTDRICLCLKALSDLQRGKDDTSVMLKNVFSKESRQSLGKMLAVKIAAEEAEAQKVKEKKGVAVQPDDAIPFGQLASRSGPGADKEDIFELSLSRAVAGSGKKDGFDQATKLSKVTQLTGFSDPVYAEAYVNVNQYDIVLDVLVVNQTGDTLQNCTLELATLGDLKLVEKPSALVLGPHDFANIKANVKVSSTENGIIFGNIVYDVHGSTSDRNVVVLNDIHIDIMDYIVPAMCTDTEFRQMWAEFEWENKVSVNTPLRDLRAYLEHLLKSTNMKCLTPEAALDGDCGFMAANLYARSVFGEDALANLSIEKNGDGPVTGHVRIRAKSQGMALSMGDKINLTQKEKPRATMAATA